MTGARLTGVDAKGAVVDRNVSITELERKLEALIGAK